MSVTMLTESEKRNAYRDAARRMFPNVDVPLHAHVVRDANETGAFIEVVIWIPREEMEKVKC